jgi:hypothetical protein
MRDASTHYRPSGECNCGRWMAAPAVVAAREAAEHARAEWNAIAPRVSGELNAEQRALRDRVYETDRAYVAARDIELSIVPLAFA